MFIVFILILKWEEDGGLNSSMEEEEESLR
jgi:hypothetical protein